MIYEWNIRLFAGLAERFGQPDITLALDRGVLDVQTLKEAIIERFPQFEQLIRISFLACDHTYAADGETVNASAELALLPPVSGGEEAAEDTNRYVITTEPISIEAVTALVIVPEHGAALTFTGTTREWTQGQRTVRLEYEAYVPMAEKMLRQIGDEVDSRWPGAQCAIAHRIGVVDIAEISVVIAVSAPHRDACYEASRYAIERLKQVVPIWKREIWEDGSEWKGHQQGPWNPAAPLQS